MFKEISHAEKCPLEFTYRYFYYTAENCKLGADMVHTAYVYNVVCFLSMYKLKIFDMFLDAIVYLLESVIKFAKENNNKTNAI